MGLLLLRTPTDELLRDDGADSREELNERVEAMLRRISSAHGLPV